MELEKAIKVLNDYKENKKEMMKETLVQAIETVLKALKNKDKEIIDMREMIVRVARTLEKKGKYELSEYILAQIEATPTFTTWEEYTTWIPKKKAEDKIESLKTERKKALRGLKGQDRYFVKQEYLFKINTLQELLEEK